MAEARVLQIWQVPVVYILKMLASRESPMAKEKEREYFPPNRWLLFTHIYSKSGVTGKGSWRV